MISDTHPIRIMAYALHDTFGYDERWSNDKGAKALLDELQRKGFAIGVTSRDLYKAYKDGYEQGRLETYDD